MSALRLGARSGVSLVSTLAHWGSLETLRVLQGDSGELTFRWIQRWASQLLRVYGVELDVVGLPGGTMYAGTGPNGVGRLFLMNHRSGLDILVTMALCEAHLVSRADLAGWPLIGLGARRLGTLFVDRSSKRSGAAVLTQMIRALERGRGIALYPEGTAFSGDEVRPLQPGAFKAAQRTGAEIVPMGIAYQDEAAGYGDESFLEHVKRVGALDRVRVAVAVGEPRSPEGTLPELRDATRSALQELVSRARDRLTP